MSIRYYNDESSYTIKERLLLRRWLREVAHEEGYMLCDVGVIFCSSQRLLQMNREYLSHDYYTDIITFDSSDLEGCGTISGELYIDVDTVHDNARLHGATPLEEMHRILVHGVLHLCGQGDKSPEQACQMRSKEDRYLRLLEQMRGV